MEDALKNKEEILLKPFQEDQLANWWVDQLPLATLINNHMAPPKLKYRIKENHKIYQIFKQLKLMKIKVQCWMLQTLMLKRIPEKDKS